MTTAIPSTSPHGLRVAIAGLGRMGMRHVQAVKELGMTVCGVADLSPQLVAVACDTHGIDRELGFTDAHAMLLASRPQAVVVATTAPSHAALVFEAVASGARHVLCEKPMATSLAEADEMLAACARAGTALAVNHQMQFMPQYTQVKALVGSEALGPLSSIVVAGSNFGLAMNVSHYFEMLRYVSGSPVRAIQAWFEPAQLANPRGPQFEDRSGRLIAWSEAGPPMYVDFSSESGHGLQCVYICRLGQISVDELSGEMRITKRKSEYRDLPTARYGMPADRDLIAIEPVDTVAPTMRVWEALLAGRAYPDGLAGRHAMGCLAAAHASHEAGGRPTRLDDLSIPLARRFAWA